MANFVLAGVGNPVVAGADSVIAGDDGSSVQAAVAGIVAALTVPIGALAATLQDSLIDAAVTGLIPALATPVGALAAAVDDPAVPDHHIAPASRLFRASRGFRHLQAPPKDPSDVLDYTISFADVLEPDESITAVEWSRSGSDTALTIGSGGRAYTHDEKTSTLWLLSGTEDVSYQSTCHIVTDHDPPREYERSFSITVTSL